ncbi:MAG: isoprenylcysteine carboxylmethyltransferase family protein [Oscillospiraceae bacterium]|nr:isoprenylcysteine carboxylmethyltransferase family protein [Oscillospiraceae bacterium]
MLFQITIPAFLFVFYAIYFAKAVMLKKQGISADLLGKGDKPKKAVWIEIGLKMITYSGAVIKFMSAIFQPFLSVFNPPLVVRVIGCVFALIGVVFFGISVKTMQNNWRAGFDKRQETSLVTSGIYQFSRNPAFVGFDLLYIGCALVFPNVAMLSIAAAAVAAFHIQIIGEERFLEEKFGREYIDYKNKVRRYL